MVQAETVAIRVPQTRFTPEPWPIGRVLCLELNPGFPQLCYLLVQILAFEVDDDLIVLRDSLDQIERKARSLWPTLESRVVRRRVHHLPKAETFVERHGSAEVRGWQCDLVQVHEGGTRQRLPGTLGFLSFVSDKKPGQDNRVK